MAATMRRQVEEGRVCLVLWVFESLFTQITAILLPKIDSWLCVQHLLVISHSHFRCIISKSVH